MVIRYILVIFCTWISIGGAAQVSPFDFEHHPKVSNFGDSTLLFAADTVTRQYGHVVKDFFEELNFSRGDSAHILKATGPGLPGGLQRIKFVIKGLKVAGISTGSSTIECYDYTGVTGQTFQSPEVISDDPLKRWVIFNHIYTTQVATPIHPSQVNITNNDQITFARALVSTDVFRVCSDRD